jgi:hypothetical protein
VNLPIKSSNDFSISKTIELQSPSRRVRFKFDEKDKNGDNNEQHTYSSDDIRLPKKYSIHRVEYQIPIHQGISEQISRIYFYVSFLFKISIHG